MLNIYIFFIVFGLISKSLGINECKLKQEGFHIDLICRWSSFNTNRECQVLVNLGSGLYLNRLLYLHRRDLVDLKTSSDDVESPSWRANSSLVMFKLFYSSNFSLRLTGRYHPALGPRESVPSSGERVSVNQPSVLCWPQDERQEPQMVHFRPPLHPDAHMLIALLPVGTQADLPLVAAVTLAAVWAGPLLLLSW